MMDSSQDRTDDAIADPSRHFGRPMEVVYDDVLDIDAKLHILESWKKDAQLLSTATNENMAGGEPPAALLQEVNLALDKLRKICGSIH
ncbi:MAG: hypothetical protein ACJ8OJ_05095 [Povalibacter sp.]